MYCFLRIVKSIDLFKMRSKKTDFTLSEIGSAPTRMGLENSSGVSKFGGDLPVY